MQLSLSHNSHCKHHGRRRRQASRGDQELYGHTRGPVCGKEVRVSYLGREELVRGGRVEKEARQGRCGHASPHLSRLSVPPCLNLALIRAVTWPPQEAFMSYSYCFRKGRRLIDRFLIPVNKWVHVHCSSSQIFLCPI